MSSKKPEGQKVAIWAVGLVVGSTLFAIGAGQLFRIPLLLSLAVAFVVYPLVGVLVVFMTNLLEEVDAKIYEKPAFGGPDGDTSDNVAASGWWPLVLLIVLFFVIRILFGALYRLLDR